LNTIADGMPHNLWRNPEPAARQQSESGKDVCCTGVPDALQAEQGG